MSGKPLTVSMSRRQHEPIPIRQGVFSDALFLFSKGKELRGKCEIIDAGGGFR